MSAKDVIRYLMGTVDYVLHSFIKDLSDEELLMRPVPGSNHIAWQLGHVIHSEQQMLASIPGAEPLALPEGFDRSHSTENALTDPPTGFCTKAEYLELYRKSREHVRAFLEMVPEAMLDQPSQGPLASIAPKVGDLLTLIADHPMMHVGQFAVVRRKLGKPRVM